MKPLECLKAGRPIAEAERLSYDKLTREDFIEMVMLGATRLEIKDAYQIRSDQAYYSTLVKIDLHPLPTHIGKKIRQNGQAKAQPKKLKDPVEEIPESNSQTAQTAEKPRKRNKKPAEPERLIEKPKSLLEAASDFLYRVKRLADVAEKQEDGDMLLCIDDWNDLVYEAKSFERACEAAQTEGATLKTSVAAPSLAAEPPIIVKMLDSDAGFYTNVEPYTPIAALLQMASKYRGVSIPTAQGRLKLSK